MLWKWNMKLSVMINLYHVYRFILILVTLTHLSQGFGDSGPFSKWQESEKIVVVLFLYFKCKIWVVLVFL